MKKNHGKSVISVIISILIIVLIIFLGYEIFYVDIFDLIDEKNEIATTVNNFNKVENKQNILAMQNTTTVEPIVNNNLDSNQSLFTDKYYYNQLDNYAKIIYDGLQENKENMKTGTYKIDFDTKFNNLLNSENGEEKLNIAFQSAWNAFTYDNMDVFYIDIEKLTLTTKTTTIATISTHRVELSNGNNISYLKDNFNSQSKIQGKLNLLEAMRKEINHQVSRYDDLEKIRQIHNWIINNVEYDTNLNSEEPYSISGALTEGKAVCEGYARSFKYLMDEIGIPCVLVSGTGTNSNGETESHAWNYVELYGKWYAIDVTWDDPIIVGNGYILSETNYKHFLKGKETFFTSHVEDGYLSPNSIEFKFPELNEEDY